MNITWTRSTTKKTGVIAGCLLALALAGCGTTAAAATPSTSSAGPAPTVTQTVAPAPVPTRTVIVQPAPVQTVYQPAQSSSAVTSCGSSGVYAGSNTSCPFALNVQQAWSASGVCGFDRQREQTSCGKPLSNTSSRLWRRPHGP